MEQWYTLNTKPNAEQWVATALGDRGIQIYLPQIAGFRSSQQHGKKPFFPCYLFAKIDLKVVGQPQLQWTPGLRRVVAFDNRPVPLADEVIELIQVKLGEIEASVNWPARNFEPGEAVQIIAGPFKDMLAIFEGPATPSQRVQVLLTILGHASRMQVDVTNIKEAPPAEASPAIEASESKRPRRTRGRGRYIKNQAE
jgi:transcriptional antiterminator RfaH